MTRWRLVGTSLVAVLALGAAACGGGGDGAAEGTAADLAVVAAAPDQTIAGGSARVEVIVEYRVGGESLSLEMSGVSDFAGGAARITMRVPLSEVDGAGDDIVIEMISIDATTGYLRLGDLIDLPPGKDWVLITAVDLGLPPEEAFGGADPAAGLDFLRGVVDNPRVAGADDVRGDPTQRYEVDIDIDALVELAAQGVENLSPSLGDTLDEFKDAVDSPIEGDVWLDDDGRVRRFAYSFDVEGLATTTTAEYFDFGTPVDLTTPPADAVVPYAEVKDQVDALISGDTSSISR